MLAGLAGVMLPIIAHLLSRKKYDLIEWGAMQFLELDPSAKRKIRLEEMLLLALRIGLVAIFAVALARPWLGGQWLGRLVSTQSRDVVLVVDGSYSMGWESKTATPQVQALQLARQFLKDLRPGDTIQVIDAREQPLVAFPESTRDAYRVREVLNDVPTPSGSADLPAAINRAIQLLSVGTNLQREIIVLTDLQALSWKVDDEILWARFDDVRSQSPIAPRVWVMDAASGELGSAANFTVERLQLSRELAVIDIPIKISTKVKYAGGDSVIARKVYLEIDQRRLDDHTIQVKLQPNGEATIEFEYLFDSPGSHLISVVLDDDALPGDNRADAVVSVTESLPVLLIDGDMKLDPTRCETYFAHAALSSMGEQRPWIKATVITPEDLNANRLKGMSIAVVANVAKLNESTLDALRQFVSSGHGLLFTLGDKVDKDRYAEMLSGDRKDLFPCHLKSIGTEEGNEKRGVRVDSSSLELPWLRPFRTDHGGSLADARWSHWWKVAVADHRGDQLDSPPLNAVERPPETSLSEFSDGIPPMGTAIVEARLTTGDPLIVSRRLGRGVTAVYSSTLDADWNTLPAKQDYVPFLHELLFSLASPIASRNLDVGAPLILAVPADLKVDDYQFLNPSNKSLPVERIDDPFQPIARLRNTTLAGVYRFLPKKPKPNEANRPEYFAVNFDRAESDLTPLTEDQRKILSGNDRLKFVADLPDLRQNMFAESSRVELWWLLLYVFLIGLGIEAWMTRRMVHGGYSTGPA